MRRIGAAWCLMLGLLCPDALLDAQSPDNLSPVAVMLPFPKGSIAERVTSLADSTQRYAVYLPSNYTPERRWPLLLLLDPRGRALLPLGRVVAVAERLGYIAISSYNSRSDETIDPNADAINAILKDADRLLSVDPHRIYLVGQSGTARAGWIYGYQLKGNVAGLIGFGAALPRGFELTPRPAGEAPQMVFYGAAGTRDYNFDEMLPLDTLLDRVNLPHRIGWFPGPHAWPEADVLTDAVEWVELMAMKFGLKPTDQRWVDSTYKEEMAEAERRGTAGDGYGAWRMYHNLAADYDGMVDVSLAVAREKSLAGRADTRRTARRLGEVVQRQLAYNRKLGAFLYEYRKESPPPLAEALARLELRDLQRRAARVSDSVDAWAAERSLANIWVYTSFYEPMDYLAKGDPGHALAILGIAQAMRPDNPDVCYQRARALVSLDREPEALAAVRCMVRAGVTAERIERDPLLAGLRSVPGYAAAVGRVRRGPPFGDFAGGN